jgi:hypothetical protein
MRAVQYAGLVGRYIRMERTATEAEQEAGEPPVIGMECVVVRVYDGAPDRVLICSDDGFEFEVGPDHDAWRFVIWPDEVTARRYRLGG